MLESRQFSSNFTTVYAVPAGAKRAFKYAIENVKWKPGVHGMVMQAAAHENIGVQLSRSQGMQSISVVPLISRPPRSARQYYKDCRLDKSPARYY
jgi:hypothetical protein